MIAAILIAALCGSERLAVKTLRDPATGALLPARKDTVAELVSLSAPRWSSRATRRRIERQVVQLEVEVIAFKSEADGDIHAIIRDAAAAGDFGSPIGRPLMVAELPKPACAFGSIHASRMIKARADFLRLVKKQHVGRLRLTGVVFFDKVHGQIGGARNGVEIHPVLKVERR